MINAHFEFLKRNLKHGKTFLRDHRNIALRQVNTYLHDALLQKTITYPEYKAIRVELINTLSWENITGVKQTSIFDELPDFN